MNFNRASLFIMLHIPALRSANRGGKPLANTYPVHARELPRDLQPTSQVCKTAAVHCPLLAIMWIH
jgi:hypothetical protein